MADSGTQAGPSGRSASSGSPKKVKTIKEGKAQILQVGNKVFYNKAQVTNRDMSIAVLRYFIEERQREIDDKILKPNKRPKNTKGAPPFVPFLNPENIEGVKVFEGLAASGLRSLRYAHEVPGIGGIVATEVDGECVEIMKQNIEVNGEAARKVHPVHADARLHMLQHPCFYEAVDIDPYGTPVQFLDSAVQSVSEGGLLMVTATDMAVLCGNHGETCFSKYGSYPLHRPYAHEGALRILLACIELHAARYKRHIVPVVSLSIDFYIRVFVRVYTSAETVKGAAKRLAYIYQSSGCDSFYLQRLGSERKTDKGGTKHTPGHGPVVTQQCPHTGKGYQVGGPIWAEPIHNVQWVKGILKKMEKEKGDYAMYSKIRGMLTTITEELPDVPLFFDLHEVCKTVKCTPPKMDTFAFALVNGGYRASTTHCKPTGIKTDAPWDYIWDVVRTWVRDHPSGGAKVPGSVADTILRKEIEHEVVFGKKPISQSRKDGVARFVGNPEMHWGPKRRHSRRDPEAAGDLNGSVRAKRDRDESGKDGKELGEPDRAGEKKVKFDASG